MDAQRFDAIAHLLSARLPRRTPLVVIGLTALGVVTRSEQDALGKKKKRKKCKGGTKKCGKKCIPVSACCGDCGLNTCCDGDCVDLRNDPANCGRCNRQCPLDGCINGACECALLGAPCPEGCSCRLSVDSGKSACVDTTLTITPCDEDSDCDLGSICIPVIGGNRCNTPCLG